jgi:hypothetical protein
LTMSNHTWLLTGLALVLMASAWWWSAALVLALAVILRLILRWQERRGLS